MPKKKVPKEHPLKQFFAQHRISQRALAEKLGTTVVSINRWLNGIWEVPLDAQDRMYALATEILRVELAELKGRVKPNG